ncbi:MAG TPA: carboxypeptidase-like regulatory domain-containing protein [Polyangiaceae bacterium]|nr:carboxypeptidase-like regulatory domain-containing protein [Polyangiaceae bacterium]
MRLIVWVIALVCALPAAAYAQAAPAPVPAGAAPAQPAQPAAANPHAANPHAAPQRPQDRSAPAADLPPGSVEATIHDASGAPQAGLEVRLGILFETVAEGQSRDSKTARTDAEGRVRFDGLKFGSSHSYRVTLKYADAQYGSMPFNLREDSGQRVLLHVYPSSSEFSKVAVRMQGFLYIAPRDDLFQFEVLYRVFNLGDVTWLPRNVVITLPKDFKAFRAEEGMTDAKFEVVEGRGAKLSGTFPPGQTQLSFRFQAPKGSDDTMAFDVDLPKGVAEMRVIAEANPTMTLQVDGFESTQSDVAQNGTRVLVTRKLVQRKDEDVGGFTAVITGLPQPGLGRWFAVAIAFVLAGIGLASARGLFDKGSDTGGGADEDREHARTLILDQLVALERSRQAEAIGPRAYQRAHQELLDALARLSSNGSAERKKKTKKRSAKRPAEASPTRASGLSRSSGKP